MNNLNVPRFSHTNDYNPSWINNIQQRNLNKSFALNRTPKKNSFTQSFISTTKTFCKQTSLHGLKNVVNSISELTLAKSKLEKCQKFLKVIFWIAIFLTGFAFTIKLIFLIWLRYDSSPIITTIQSTSYPIWNVPFPAVTICNINKVYKPATENITKLLLTGGVNKTRIRSFLKTLDRLINLDDVNILFYRIFEILESYNYTTEMLMREIMEPCTLMMQNCAWLGNPVPCEQLFQVSKSTEGFCCSFNYKGLSKSLREDSDEIQNDRRDDQKQSYHVSGAGTNVGLSALIRIEPDEYMAYSKSFYGAYILIHGPQDFPQASVVTTALGQPGSDLTLAITPTITISEQRIRRLSIEKRNCLFEDEKTLRTTDKYNYQTCITECSVDTILEKCRCLPFFYPEINMKNFSKTIRQCTLMDVKCLSQYQHIFFSLQPKTHINDGIEGEDISEMGMNCNQCLPSCTEESYAIQTIQARRHPEDNLFSSLYNSYNLSSFMTIRVNFKDIVCIQYRRDIHQTWDALLAAFYGVFGLCLGGSVVSIIEIIYFLTLQLYSNYDENNSDKIERIKPNQIHGNQNNNQLLQFGSHQPVREMRMKINTEHGPINYWGIRPYPNSRFN